MQEESRACVWSRDGWLTMQIQWHSVITLREEEKGIAGRISWIIIITTGCSRV